jgi:uncharacterized protein
MLERMGVISEASLEAQLAAFVAKSSSLMRALEAARSLGLSSWCIGAGAVRNVVWDQLHCFEAETPAEDMDLVFFDDNDLSQELERLLENRLSLAEPSFNWEVVNQAGVHRWLQPYAGKKSQPFRSLAEGIASWPEVATCVGVTLTGSRNIEVIAPHGLADLFEMVVRWNPRHVSRSVYAERVAKKRFAERWPQVRVLAC